VAARSAILLTILSLTGVGCVPLPAARADGIEAAALRSLAELEPQFQDFIATPIAGTGPAQSLDNLEQEIGRLLELRLVYLEQLVKHSGSRYGLLGLVRVAEMHLDLAARARALPAPTNATPDNVSAFFEIVEVYAFPLEETGLTILEQVDKVGASVDPQSPWLLRARLYLGLHAGDRFPRYRRDSLWLRREVVRELRFSPPHSLLDEGRLAPRAARLLP